MASVGIVAAVLGAFAVFVWPTAWRDRTFVEFPNGPHTGRQQRFTGEIQVLCVDGWHRLAVDPFSDLDDRHLTAEQKRDPCLTEPFVKGWVPPASR